jgi:predicted DCC family thiol-disulfide oxidoreductase YuxK
MNPVKTVAFFDGGCTPCSREISHYRRLDTAGRIEWIDISRDTNLLEAFGITPDAAMARLHVLHRDGWMATGAYAFAVIWSELPYCRWLSRLLYGAGLLHVLERVYVPFARWRLQRRCKDGGCTSPERRVARFA